MQMLKRVEPGSGDPSAKGIMRNIPVHNGQQNNNKKNYNAHASRLTFKLKKQRLKSAKPTKQIEDKRVCYRLGSTV